MTKEILKPPGHSINTWSKHQLQRPNANLLCFLEIAFYTGMKVFNSLPFSLTPLGNEKEEYKAV